MSKLNESKSKIESLTFTPLHPLNTAVLFLVFNRLDTTKKVFEMIRQAKPLRLYIASDGARADRESEAKKVQVVRVGEALRCNNLASAGDLIVCSVALRSDRCDGVVCKAWKSLANFESFKSGVFT